MSILTLTNFITEVCPSDVQYEYYDYEESESVTSGIGSCYSGGGECEARIEAVIVVTRCRSQGEEGTGVVEVGCTSGSLIS